jgi:hypothetical protein
MKYCNVDGCINKHEARGFCSKHYLRLKIYGSVDDRVRKPWPEKCLISGCVDSVRVKKSGYCWRHYQQHLKGTLGISKTNERHGLHDSSEYASWQHMKDRCLNQKNMRYVDYGGRGIKVCERWQKSFKAFLEDMGLKQSSTLSINRVNNDAHYSCGNCNECKINNWEANCDWADDYTQKLNQRIRKNNKSGHKNISWDRFRSAWMVRIKRHKKYVFGGRFNMLEEAIIERDNFLLKYENGNRKPRITKTKS